MRVSFSQPVQNGVVEVRVSPALLCPGASLAWVAGIDGDEHAPPEDELAVAMVTGMQGNAEGSRRTPNTQ